MYGFLALISFIAVVFGVILTVDSSLGWLGLVLIFCGIVGIIYFMAKIIREDTLRIKETKPCPTCNGSRRVEREEENSGLVN